MSLLTNRLYREEGAFRGGPQGTELEALGHWAAPVRRFVDVPQGTPTAGTPGTSSGGTAPFRFPTTPGAGPGMPGAGTGAPMGGSPGLWDILQMQYQPHQFPEHERTRIEAFLQKSLAPYIGQASLTQLLLNQGRTDPARLNQQMVDIQRRTQGAQQSTQGELAQRGLGASGLGQALAAAQGQAGNETMARAQANENQLAEQRWRDDLDLLNRVFQQPYQHSEDRAMQQYLGERSTQGGGGLGGMFGGLSNIAGLVSQVMPLLKGMKWGTGGTSSSGGSHPIGADDDI